MLPKVVVAVVKQLTVDDELSVCECVYVIERKDRCLQCEAEREIYVSKR